MPWIVGRGNFSCYVEETEVLNIGGVDCGEQCFDDEISALEFAIGCEEDLQAETRSSLRDLRSRLKKARRAGVSVSGARDSKEEEGQ